MCNNFRESKRSGGRIAIKVALDEVQVGRESAKPFEGGAIGEIAETQDLAYLSGSEEFLELEIVSWETW